jgi:hypothetical protein
MDVQLACLPCQLVLLILVGSLVWLYFGTLSAALYYADNNDGYQDGANDSSADNGSYEVSLAVLAFVYLLPPVVLLALHIV